MINIEKQIAYWHDGAIEDWEVAQGLLSRHQIRHGLFFLHLALEKLLKAHVCQQTQDLAPRIHNLVRLAELTALAFSSDHMDISADINAFNLEGRYPDTLMPPPSTSEALAYSHRAQGVYQWLMSQF
ncbi:MAG: HEPN domain-containing protein [Chloroflexi bacterium]|nr:HEPN domain-containing protein [Chloroflexota bacterium]